MSINENADLDPSQVEDLRGKSGGGGGLPGLGGGGGGGGGLSGGNMAAGAGCLTALLPMFKKNPKLGCAVVIIAVICIGGFLCLNGSNIGTTLGGIGGIGGGGAVQNEPEGNTDLQQACSTANPDRFQRTDCRNLLYINSIQAYWQQALPQYFGQPYQKATTRLFSGAVNTACGSASSGVGPFYCPGDNHVYIDLTFYDELAQRFGAPAQFEPGYVLAQE